jgi:ABC-type sugar transport system ATPase subunit
VTGPGGVAPTLEVDQVVKHFGGVRALDGVDLEIRSGEVHCLCGENGAGKSTLIKILGGVHQYGNYRGSIRIDGREARFRGARDAARAGIAVIYQELMLVEAMSVAENLFLGDWPRRGPLIDWPRMVRESAELLCQFGVDVDPESRAGSLGIGRKQQVEILKAVRKRSRVLILDEPTAALGETEVRSLLDLVRRLAHQGVACLYITHRLEEVRSIADRVTVFRDGRNVASFEGGAVSARDLIRAMAGRPLPTASPRRPDSAENGGPPLLEVSSLEVNPPLGETLRLDGISFALRAGEVLGLAGLMGSGRSELLMHLYGAWGTRRAGSVRLCGQIHDSPSPERSLKRGMALLTEDRRRFGLIPDQSVVFNLTLSSLPQLIRHGLIDAATEIQTYRQMKATLRVAAASPVMPVRRLSGGNQQKVLLGRVLLTAPRVILLDEPTRGVDVATKFEIYDLINRLTEEGRGVVLVSSELPELLGLCDRLLVLRGGRIAAELPRDRLDQERTVALMLGHDDEPEGRESMAKR